MAKRAPKIVTKNLPSIDLYGDASSAKKNLKYTRLVWRTHNDFHNHKFWEICLVLKGRGKNHFLTHTEEMRAGCMWLLRPHDVHMIEPLTQSSQNTYAHRDIYIEEETMKRILNGFGEGYYDKLLHADAPLFSQLPISEVMNIETIINEHSLSEIPLEFIHSVITSYIIACAIEHNARTAKKATPAWLNRLLDKLNDLDFLVLPMKEIISFVGYSQEYICREFKKHTGTTLSKYIRKMKCMHSLSLLEDTDIPVVNIASMLYFPDESNYITNFRKIYNVTPGEWRRRVRGKQTKV